MADDDDPGAVAVELPPFVTTDADRTRWENAGTVAADALGPDASAEELWQARRSIFHDRRTYPD